MGKKIVLTEDETEELWQEEADITLSDGSTIYHVDNGDWNDDGKYSYSDLIVKDDDGVHYRSTISRTGGYYTDYHYQFGTEFHEVEKKEVVRSEWINVN